MGLKTFVPNVEGKRAVGWGKEGNRKGVRMVKDGGHRGGLEVARAWGSPQGVPSYTQGGPQLPVCLCGGDYRICPRVLARIQF